MPPTADSLDQVYDGPYLAALDQVVAHASEQRHATFKSILTASRGAFPLLVIERLKLLGLWRLLPPSISTEQLVRSQWRGPEPHPLDYEWYFTRHSAGKIVQHIAQRPGKFLFLGAPTVALATASHGWRSVLIDRDPYVSHRLGPNPRVVVEQRDLSTPLLLDHKYNVVFFDAPWYEDYTNLWLWGAARAISPGGLIGFVLFKDLLRPSADAQRGRILERAGRYGAITVIENAAIYETPVFEQETFLAHHVDIGPAWRRGDLVLIRNAHDDETPTPNAIEDMGQWESFRVGPQIVKLRNQTNGLPEIPIGLVPGCDSFAFGSVSRRDPRREMVDLWTSRNRVASVGRRDLVESLLLQLGANTLGDAPDEEEGAPSARLGALEVLRDVLQIEKAAQ